MSSSEIWVARSSLNNHFHIPEDTRVRKQQNVHWLWRLNTQQNMCPFHSYFIWQSIIFPQGRIMSIFIFVIFDKSLFGGPFKLDYSRGSIEFLAIIFYCSVGCVFALLLMPFVSISWATEVICRLSLTMLRSWSVYLKEFKCFNSSVFFFPFEVSLHRGRWRKVHFPLNHLSKRLFLLHFHL